MQEIAERAAARDLFVLRRVAPDRLFNTDGHGRGAGWAGNVSVDPAYEPWVARALEDGLARRASGVPFRTFGPYWATDVAAVWEDDDLVVFGGGRSSELGDDELRAIAADARSSANEVTQDKIEADEAEVRQALEALTGVPPGTLEDMATHVATVTAAALSCEFGAVLLTDPLRLFMAAEGWRPAASDEEIVAALMPLVDAAREGILVEQDLSESSFPYRPLSFDDGLVARCVVPLGTDARLGILVAAHAGTAPRGFTMLCQRVARTMGEHGEPLIARALGRG